MKKFEDELRDNNLEILVSNTGSSLYGQSYVNYVKVVELSEGWVSPEDHQAEIDKRKQQYEEHQEIYSKTAKKLNEVELELSKLKSQLEKQQPDIPEFVAEFITKLKKANNNLTFAFSSRVNECPAKYWNEAILWLFTNPEEFAQAWINGYTVETPKAIVTPCPVCGYEEVESNFCSICGRKNDYE